MKILQIISVWINLSLSHTHTHWLYIIQRLWKEFYISSFFLCSQWKQLLLAKMRTWNVRSSLQVSQKHFRLLALDTYNNFPHPLFFISFHLLLFLFSILLFLIVSFELTISIIDCIEFVCSFFLHRKNKRNRVWLIFRDHSQRPTSSQKRSKSLTIIK